MDLAVVSIIQKLKKGEDAEMNTRGSVIMTAMAVLVLTAVLMPISGLLASQEELSNRMIMQTLVDYREHQESWNGNLVEPLMDIEDAWNIEDTRTESPNPLITRMLCNGAEMGYDRGSRTFYCTLGMDENVEWIPLEIFAGGVQAKLGSHGLTTTHTMIALKRSEKVIVTNS